jgi:predicted HicB family RNase H-like nuclease
MKLKSYPLRLSEELHKELKLYCVEKGISMQDFILGAIEEKADKKIFTPERTAV